MIIFFNYVGKYQRNYCKKDLMFVFAIIVKS